jgi:hypothetical protein
MALKIAYFQPIILLQDTVPPVEFSKIYNLVESAHQHTELNDSENPLLSIKGGKQVQVYPNELGVDVGWLIKWFEEACQGYIELVIAQSGTDELKYVEPKVTSIWTIRQTEGDYQAMHHHPGGHISGNVYVTAPAYEDDKKNVDGNIYFRLPQPKDLTKFMMHDSWKHDGDPGTFVIFPSYLPHTVYPWKGAGYRTVLAFDAMLVPKQELLNGQT